MNGGQIVNSPEVENYPGIKRISGFQFIQKLQQQAEESGAVIVNRQAEKLVDQGGRKVVMTSDGLYESRTAILCTGVIQRKLGLEWEKELTGCGVSYCAVCDGREMMRLGIAKTEKSVIMDNGSQRIKLRQ